MKKLPLKMISIVLICTMHLNLNAQKITTTDTAGLKAKTKIDLTDLLKKPIYKAGENVVTKLKSGYTIYVKLTEKKLPEYIVKSKSGQMVPSTIMKTKTNCWNCWFDSNNERNCEKIPCPTPLKSAFAGAKAGATGTAVL